MRKSFRSYIRNDLKQIEEYIRDILEPNLSITNSESFDLFVTGGKKLRPSLALLVGKLGEPNKYEDCIRTGASLELIHMASLVHDDIIDDSEVRRKRKTTYYKHGYFQAVNTGNLLISSAIECVAHIENIDFHKTYSEAMGQIVSGELFQFDTQFDYSQSINDYYEKIYKKTALLIILSIKLGAYSTQVNQKTRKNLEEFGYLIGMSFQIIDDCLDFTSKEEVLGKPKFSDLKNGHYTLPVLLLRDKDSEFEILLQRYSQTKENSELLSNYVLNSDAIKESKIISEQFLNQALTKLEYIEEPIKSYLKEIVEKLRHRLK